MNLKKRLIISNFMMIALPFIISCIIGVVAILFMHHSYWYPVEEMFSDRNELVYAQSLIYGELDNLGITDEGRHEQRDMSVNRLVVELADLGYHVQYRLNGKELFSNITPEDEEKGQEMLGTSVMGLDHVTASKDGVFLIKAHWIKNGNTISVEAINPGKFVKPVNFSFIYTYIGFFVFLMFFCVLLTMALVSAFVYRRMKKEVVDPLQQISNAAKAIRNGNLSTQVTLLGAEEFQEVGRNFMEMQDYLRDSVAKDIAYNKKRKELLSGISHDLRTPLTSIKGYAEGLQAGIADTPEKQRRYYEAILTRAKDLERLVDNLSLYNQFETELFMQNNFQVISFSTLLQTYLTAEQERFRADHITIEWAAEPIEDIVLADVTEFRRVFDNLFNNAVKYRVKDTSCIRLRLDRKDKFLVFLFSDDGPGIDDEHIEDIFEAFVRLDTARSHTNEGSGLGLAIVKRIIEGHKGSVRAYNDQGLTICIALPLYKNG